MPSIKMEKQIRLKFLIMETKARLPQLKKYQSILFSFILMLSTFSVTAQTQIGSDIDGEAAGDWSGFSVSMPDGNTVAIGAHLNDDNGTNAGHVRIYKLIKNQWLQKGGDIDGDSANDVSGMSVVMPDSNTVAIGAPFNDGNSNNSGHVRIYKWRGNTWIQIGNDIDGEAMSNLSGFSVSMPDSNIVAIGAHGNNDNGSLSGHVRIYRWNGSSWLQKGSDIDGEAAGDYSGQSVSMPDSNTVAIGAPRNSGNGSEAGHVRIYNWNGNFWVQKGGDIDGEAAGDWLGYSVSMSDSITLAIGGNHNDGNGADAGHVRIYRWRGSSWVQKGMDIDGDSAGDYLGYSVRMPDSNTVAIGAPKNNDNGTNVGHVRIYRWNGNSWIRKIADIDGEAAGDWSGVSVSMPDSNTIAIGARSNDGNGIDAGHVRVFSLCNTADTITPVACVAYTSPSGNYIWTNSGVYTDVLPNASGCDSIITVDLTINLDTTVALIGDTLVSNDTSATYQWVNCDNGYAPVFGAGNRRFIPPNNDNYAVIITKNGCSDTSSCYNVVVSGLSDHKESNYELLIYPNPTNELFTIEQEVSANTPFEVRDITGKIVLKGNLRDKQTTIDLSENSSGVYILRVGDENVKVVRK